MKAFTIFAQVVGVISSFGILATFILMFFSPVLMAIVGNISLVGLCVAGVCMFVEPVLECGRVKRAKVEDVNEICLNE
jgi:4-hydroxybenzoate polyprenyltransferase